VDVKNGELKEETFTKNWTIITKYLIPDLGQIPIERITPKQVIQTIRPLDARGRAETRDRAIALLNRVMKFAVNCNALEFNKCVNVKDHYSRPKAEHYKTIRPEELPELLTALKDYQLSTQTKLLIKWQLLTMTRPNESVGALWEEIDLDAKTWTIPAHKMKMKVAHVIPLSTQSLAIRQHLTAKQLELIDMLTSENATMIKLGMNYESRKAQLTFSATYFKVRNGLINKQGTSTAQ
ncbi:tyrosine-type recombinase/integrase, partial [[Pasteurella] aerogenes]